MTTIDGSVAIVTGAASGMGEATARLMREQGWPLVLCDKDEALLRRVAGEDAQAAVALAVGDIAAPAFFDALDAALARRPVGALIHCAGLSPTLADPPRILDVNLAATMRLTRHVLPLMAPKAAAVLFASSSGHLLGSVLDERIDAADEPEKVAALIDLCPDPGMAYTVSKRGVMLLARREAHRFGARDTRVNSLSPGIIDTPMGRSEMAKAPIIQELVAGSSLARQAHPREVATVAAFLCSPQASFVTGTDVLVDGGSLSRGGPRAARQS